MSRFTFACGALVAFAAVAPADEPLPALGPVPASPAAPTPAATAAPAAAPKLTPQDARYLERLLADCLFDPTGAERVAGEFPFQNQWGEGTTRRDGWLVRGGPTGNRVYFAGGESEPAPARLVGIDFAAACRERYAAAPAKEAGVPRQPPTWDVDATVVLSIGGIDSPVQAVGAERDLTLAAWLHKLGHHDLAAKALAAARAAAAENKAAPDPRDALRHHLAELLFADFAEAYETFRDEDALRLGAKLFARYRDVVRHDPQSKLWQAESMLADLHRRRAAGALAAGEPRVGLTDLPEDKGQRTAALIRALEDVTARRVTHRGFRGGNDPTLDNDWRVRALVSVGEDAVPALLDAFEHDGRRTRSVDHPSVREPILYALRQILRVQLTDNLGGAELLGHPAGTGPKFQAACAKLRAYWAAYGKLPFDERMMKVLTDPTAAPAAATEAMWNLVNLQQNDPDSSPWLSELFPSGPLAKFAGPTVPEAILAARTRFYRAQPAEGRGRARYWNGQFQCEYLNALVRLGDRRVALAVVELAAAQTDLSQRLALAQAALHLGRTDSLRALAREVETGAFKLRPPAAGAAPPKAPWLDDRLDDLNTALGALTAANTDFGERALAALADPKHPLNRPTVALLIRGTTDNQYAQVFGHAFWIAVARSGLEDTTPTGRVYAAENDQITVEEDGAKRQYGIVEELSSPELRRAKAAERVCDRLAMRLSRGLHGAPEYHPLRTDAAEQFAALGEFVCRFGGRFRALEDQNPQWNFRRFNGRQTDNLTFYPHPRPLNRAATVTDVGAGDAVFHLNGKGEAAVIDLPIWVFLKDGSRGIAVQAEAGPDGKIVYGVIFRREMGPVAADEVVHTQPLNGFGW